MKRNNIILILIDSARADHFSCYGYGKNTTPFIQEIVQESVLYKNAIAPAVHTLPSISSILTGLYFPATDRANKVSLLDRFNTLPEILKDFGYRTAAITSNAWVSPATGLNKGFDRFIYFNKRNAFNVLSFSTLLKYLLKSIKNRERTNFVITEEAKREIKKNHKSPFFLYLHYSTHHPYGMFCNRRSLKPFIDTSRFKKSDIENIKKQQKNMINLIEKGTFKEEAREILIGLYNSHIRYVDGRLENLIRYIKKIGILDNTALIITSDHGDSLGEHGLITHSIMLYDELLRVPLIIKYPDSFSKKGISENLVSTIDILPTILDIIGSRENRYSKYLQGVSLLRLENSKRDFVISRNLFTKELADKRSGLPNIREYIGEQIALRSLEYKFIKISNDRENRYMLFNLKNNPAEENNVITKESDIGKYFSRELEKYQGLLRLEGVDKTEVNFDKAMEEQLSTLGYL